MWGVPDPTGPPAIDGLANAPTVISVRRADAAWAAAPAALVAGMAQAIVDDAFHAVAAEPADTWELRDVGWCGKRYVEADLQVGLSRT